MSDFFTDVTSMPRLFECVIKEDEAEMVRSLWEGKGKFDLRNKHSHTGMMIASGVGAINVIQEFLILGFDVRFVLLLEMFDLVGGHPKYTLYCREGVRTKCHMNFSVF